MPLNVSLPTNKIDGDAGHSAGHNATNTAVNQAAAAVDALDSATTSALAGKQPLDADLTTIAGLTATTDNVMQAKAGAWASRTPTQVAADLVTPLSSSLQPLDSDLTAIAAIAPTNDDIIQRKAGAWTNRTMAQVKTDLALTKSDVGLSNVTNNAQVTGVTAGDATITIGGTSTAPTVAVTGSTFQPLDADLTTIATLDATTAGALVTDGSGWIRKTYAQLKTALALGKSDVGLSNVDNTSDASKPVSTATQTALDLKAALTVTDALDVRVAAMELPEYATSAQTAAVTAAGMYSKLVRYDTTGGAINQTLPAATAGKAFAVGWDAGTAAVTLTAAGSDVIGSGATTSFAVSLPGEVIAFHCTNAGRWRVTYGFKSLSQMDIRYGLSVHTVGNSGTALTLDASATGQVKTVTLTGNCTFTLTGATSGLATMLELVLTQDGTGSRTVTWPASVKWAGGAPTLTTTASATDRIVLVTYNGGTTWYGDVIGKAYA